MIPDVHSENIHIDVEKFLRNMIIHDLLLRWLLHIYVELLQGK